MPWKETCAKQEGAFIDAWLKLESSIHRFLVRGLGVLTCLLYTSDAADE